MHIYIDESGVFNIPTYRKWSVSCVGALVIPDSNKDEIFKGFKKWRRAWGYFEGEIKGRALNENEIASLIEFLAGFDLILEITAIDMVMQSHQGIVKHRFAQTDAFTENLTDQYHPNFVKQVKELQQKLRKLANPLYVQAICTFKLLYSVFQKATLYYVQRKPHELSDFHWIIDAKGKDLTPFENIWTTIVLPVLQSESLRNPFITLTGADYSYLEKFFHTKEQTPGYLRYAIGDKSPFHYVEINEIFKRYLRFEQSHKNTGLELVDVLTTSVRRAMNGNLQFEGWGNIGRLMITSERGTNTIRLIDLCGRPRPKYGKTYPPYWDVVRTIDRSCKPLLIE
jgi:hypothetical protein